MDRSTLSLVFFCATLLLISQSVSAVTIDTVPVGNPGNAADATVMFNDGTTGYGAVAYNYRIGTYEVTNTQYAAFLNAKAKSDPLGLYNDAMGDALEPNFGGITRDGTDGNYAYATISGRGNKPVNWVSWYDAIRFANWLHNNQGSGDTETGAYVLGELNPDGVPLHGDNITRNAGANWFLPSENEWHKAAYHKNDGATGNYFQFPTSNDTEPTAEAPAGGGNSANNLFVVGDLTDVGAYAASDGPYGTFDQGGNAYELNETLLDKGPSVRGMRGGSFYDEPFHLQSSFRGDITLSYTGVADQGIGFRVATVPEPPTLALAAFGAIGLLFAVRR